MRIVPYIIILFSSFPALAQDMPVLDEKACAFLATHIPDEDVAYKPGIDVHGKPVVEADLSSAPVNVPKSFSFDITVDVADYVGLNLLPSVEGKPVLGAVHIDDKGNMTWNGQPLEGEEASALKSLCMDDAEYQDFLEEGAVEIEPLPDQFEGYTEQIIMIE